MNDHHDIDGKLADSLTPDELAWLNLKIERGEARLVYEGIGALMGLAKVRLSDISAPL